MKVLVMMVDHNGLGSNRIDFTEMGCKVVVARDLILGGGGGKRLDPRWWWW